MLRARLSVVGLGTDNGKNWETRPDASFENMQMQCGWWHGKMQQASEWQGNNSDNWETPGASVSGHYNTRPLQEGLVPRSKDGTGEKRKRKRRGKTKLFLWPKEWNQRTLKSWTTWKKEYNGDERSWKHPVRKEEQGRTIYYRTPVEKRYNTW